MASPKTHAEDDLVDYEEDAAVGTIENNSTNNIDSKKGIINNGATSSGNKNDLTKGSYVGIHSSGFRDFLLKSELLLAVTDCGFEHPR